MNINLQLTFDRLGPVYKSGHPYYSLLLTVGFGDGADATRANVMQYLQPWNWTIVGLTVVDAAHAMAAVPFDLAPAPTLGGFDALKRRLLQELGDQVDAKRGVRADQQSISGEHHRGCPACEPPLVRLAGPPGHAHKRYFRRAATRAQDSRGLLDTNLEAEYFARTGKRAGGGARECHRGFEGIRRFGVGQPACGDRSDDRRGSSAGRRRGHRSGAIAAQFESHR